jgi:3-isopropylmalate/(R)-2-methylmalate dehydratase small subunit
MKPVNLVQSVTMPLLRDNIDTDAIIPSREIRSIGKTGLANGLFAGWRYSGSSGRTLNPAFVMNDPKYRDAQILLTGKNFGCGSSREHAAWALAEYGFKAVVAASFNPIFFGNCVRNGIIPVEFDATQIPGSAIDPREEMVIDLANQTLATRSAGVMHFPIDAESKAMLLGGLDMIDLTLQRADEIAAFRDRDRIARPWVYLHKTDRLA